MRRWVLVAGLVLLGGFLSRPAGAQNGSTAGVLELYPTLWSIGARLAYTGDADSDATAYIEWRPLGGGAWTRGVDMARITGSRWAGSVLFLRSARGYEVRTVIVDPDGGSSATGSTVTRDDFVPAPTMPPIFVAVNGNDGGLGTAAAPLATLQEAVNRAQPGSSIRIYPGIYYQTADVNVAGTAENPIRIEATGPGVVLDGADPAFINRNDWRNDGGGVYSLPFIGETRLVAVDSLQRLYHHDSSTDLQNGAKGVPQGWVIESGRIWIRLEGNVSPIGHRVYVARHDVGIRLDQDHWLVTGLEVRHFGTLFPDFDYVSAGILIQADRCVVRDCHLHLIGGRPLFLRDYASDALIERNLVRDPTIPNWSWDAVKGNHDAELTGISNRGGRGNVIRFNTVTGMFNGVDVRKKENVVDEQVAADCDIHHNVMSKIGDDAVETDEVSGINVRIWRNRFDDVFVGFSIAPINQGPEYVLYNTVNVYQRSAFKPGGVSTGHVWNCHNTLYGTISGKAAVHGVNSHYSNMHFRNNILVSNGRAVVDDESSESFTGNDFDGDLLRRNGTAGTLFLWKSQPFANLPALRAGTGFELLGYEGDPLFVSPGAGNLAIQAGSPARDHAIRLTGINDNYLGSAPDIGAHEYGVVVDVSEALRQQPVRLGPVVPNPSRGAAAVRFAMARAGHVVLAIHDLAGRSVRRLEDREREAGEHQVVWDGRDDRGRAQPAGIYFARLAAGGQSLEARLVRLR